MKWRQSSLTLGVCAAMLITLAGCGGGESESIGTPAAGDTSRVVSTQDGSQTGDGKEAGNTNTTANDSGITTIPTTATGLSADLERQIKEDYIEKIKERNPDDKEIQNMTANNVTIYPNVTRCSGCIVLFITTDNVSHSSVITEEKVAGYIMEYGSTLAMSVYKDGEFSGLTDAYEKGWITREDVKMLTGGKTAPTE